MESCFSPLPQKVTWGRALGKNGVVVSGAPWSVVWLQLLSAQMVTLDLPKGHEQPCTGLGK